MVKEEFETVTTEYIKYLRKHFNKEKQQIKCIVRLINGVDKEMHIPTINNFIDCVRCNDYYFQTDIHGNNEVHFISIPCSNISEIVISLVNKKDKLNYISW